MNHTPKHWLRASLALVLAICMLIGTPLSALAATSSTTCVNEEAVTNAVDTAINYCDLAQQIIDVIVDKVIDDDDYYSLLGESKTSSTIKKMAIQKIEEEITDDMMEQAGLEPTDENRTMLANEVYEVAIMYYDYLEANGGKTSQTAHAGANEVCMKEIVRFALVEIKGHPEDEAVETAEFYYEINQVYLRDGKDAATAYAQQEMGSAHTYSAVWTWAEGYGSATATFTCSACGHAEENVAATVTSSTTAASCETEGKTVYTATVTLDGADYTDTKTVAISATGHSYGDVTWTWADDYSTAKASKTCAKCGDVMEADGTVVTETVTEATCETSGEYKHTATATLDGQTVTDTKTQTVTVSHSYGEPTWAWEGTSKATATFTCGKCGDTEDVTATVSSSVTTKATCEEDGVTTYTATVTLDGDDYTDTKTEAIEATGHSYGDAQWTWSKDYSSASVSKTCANCDDDITAKATVTSKTEQEASCEQDGKIVHTATATLDGESLTDTQTETVAGGHSFSNGKCTVCGMTLAQRIYGDNRYKTAMKVADQLMDVLGVDKFDAIIVSSGTEFADALAGSYLATVKKAPILLTNKFNIDNVVKYITDNLADNGTVYILGGTGAVSEDFADAVTEALGKEPKRLEGRNRYLTNLAILEEAVVSKNQEILVCSGLEFPDSLSASASGKPILMVKSSLTDDQKTYLDSLGGAKFIIVGGTGAVSEAVVEELKAYGSVETRLAGENRYDTSLKVAEYFYADADTAVLAYGKNYPDGLCGGVLAYFMEAPLLLTYDGRADFTAEYTNEAGITGGLVLGGTDLISDDSVRTILDLEKDTEIPTI